MLVKVRTAYGTFWKQTELADLIREVDSYRGKPSPEAVKKLAEKYGDTEAFVRSLFRTRRYRKGRKWRKLRREGTARFHDDKNASLILFQLARRNSISSSSHAFLSSWNRAVPSLLSFLHFRPFL